MNKYLLILTILGLSFFGNLSYADLSTGKIDFFAFTATSKLPAYSITDSQITDNVPVTNNIADHSHAASIESLKRFNLPIAFSSQDLPKKLSQYQCDRFKALKTCCGQSSCGTNNCNTCGKNNQCSTCGVKNSCGAVSDCCSPCAMTCEEEVGENNFDTWGGGFGTGIGVGGGSGTAFVSSTGGGSGSTGSGTGTGTETTTGSTTGSTTASTTSTTTGTQATEQQTTLVVNFGPGTGPGNIEVPEPGTITILGGMLGICAYLKRKFAKNKK